MSLLIEFAKTRGHPIKIVRMDSESVFRGSKFMKILADNHIEAQISAPYSSQWHDGMIELMWRILSEAVQAMISEAKLGKEYWESTLKTVVYIHNRIPRKGRNISPFEMLTGRREKLANTRKFGCPAYLNVPINVKNKFDPKSKKGIFAGYSNDSHAYLVLFPETGRVTTSRDVIFDEKLDDLSEELAKREALRLERQANFDEAIKA